MAKKSKKTKNAKAARPSKSNEDMGIGSCVSSWLKKNLQSSVGAKASSKLGVSRIDFVGSNFDSFLSDKKAKGLQAWQVKNSQRQKQTIFHYEDTVGSHFIVRLDEEIEVFPTRGHYDLLKASEYSRCRDQAGELFEILGRLTPQGMELSFWDCSAQMIKGVLSGLDMAAYRYKDIMSGSWRWLPEITISKDSKKVQKSLESAAHLAASTNLARHLVNLPSNILHPTSYSQWLKKEFGNANSWQVEVWDQKRLEKENMNLHVAVGRGAEFPPCLVIMRYRPVQKGAKKTPIAFVGKGITFDSGGLDLKPSRGMRWMKKDMGGSACLVGLAYWLKESKSKQAVDFYLPLAENAVDERSFRPGDVLKSRSGKTVEIHNTDAEGRLVLADALELASSKLSKDASCLVDVATLTGAIKVGLGSQIAGLMSNDDELAQDLENGSQAGGDLVWRVPLLQSMRDSLASPIADMVNATDGFGGAITAGLFLESFVNQKKWAHMDIYAWSDQPNGALREPGGSGQGVQLLVNWLES